MFVYLTIAIIAWFLLTTAPKQPEAWNVAASTALGSLTLIACFAQKSLESYRPNWLTIDILFSFTFFLIHFAYFTYWLAGLTDGTNELWNYGHLRLGKVVCKALFMYDITLACFLAGFSALKTVPRPEHNPFLTTNPYLAANYRKLGKTLLYASFALFCVYVGAVGPEVVFGAYSGTDNKGFLPNVCFQLGQALAACGISISVASDISRNLPGRGNSRSRAWLLIVIGTLAAAIALHGDRSTFAWIVLTVMVTHSEYIRPIRLRTLAISFFGFMFLMGFLLVLRTGLSNEEGVSIAKNINRAMLNFGGSSLCGLVAIEHVDSKGIQDGYFQLLPILGLIPFGRTLFGITDGPEYSSSALLTLLINRQWGSGVSGTGTTIFADFYFDFGLTGTAIAMLAVGLFCKAFQNSSRKSPTVIKLVGFVCLTVFMALVSRYSFTAGFIRLVIYSMIYTWLVGLSLGTDAAKPLHVSRQI
jgi:oligosaccharide repeat unit polymerase